MTPPMPMGKPMSARPAAGAAGLAPAAADAVGLAGCYMTPPSAVVMVAILFVAASMLYSAPLSS